MKAFLRTLIEDLNDNDPAERERRANFRHTILLFGIGMTLVATIAIYFANPKGLPAVALNATLILLQVAILFIGRQGYHKTASLLTILLFELYCAAAMYFFGGIRNPVSTTLLLMVMVAAMLLGQAGIILTIVIAGVVTLWLTFLETNHLLPVQAAPIIPIQNWIAYFSTLVGGAVVMFAWYSSIRIASQRASRELAERKKAEDENLKRIADLEALNSVSQIVVAAKDIETLIDNAGEKILALFDAPVTFIALLDEEAGLIRFQYYRLNEVRASAPLRLGEGMTSQIILERRPILINSNWAEEARRYNVVDEFPDIPILSSLGVPMLAGERAIGALCLQDTRREYGFDENDLRLLSTIASNLAIAIENIHLQNSLHQELLERKQAEAALRASEEQYRIISSVSSDYAFMTRIDPNGDTYEEWVSDAFQAITGYTHAELLALGGWAAVLHPDDREHDAQGLVTVLMNQRVTTEERIIRKDGETRWIRIHAQPVWDEAQQRVIKIYGAVQDITDRKKAEQEIQDSNNSLEQNVIARTAELETTVRELEAFSYNISHYVRAPLRGLHGYASLLASEYSSHLPIEAQTHLKRIQTSARLMDQLINDLLAYNRLGRVRPSKSMINIRDVFSLALDELIREVPERKFNINMADLPPAYADMKLIKVVAHHLLSNAIKFSNTQTETNIEVGSLMQNGKTVYYVKDNGIGFDMKYTGKLFKVFQQLNDPGQFGGTGIGLAITERIILKHGGKVWAESEPDKGATFFFTLG